MSDADALPDYRLHVRMIVQEVAPETINPKSGRFADHTFRDFNTGRTVKECADRWLMRRLVPQAPAGDAA